MNKISEWYDTLMRVRVRYLGPLREITKRGYEHISIPGGMSLSSLITMIRARHPEIDRIEFSVALNGDLIPSEDMSILHDGDEIALIPPVSGGGHSPITVKITKRMVSIQDAISSIFVESAGASVIFLGRVRPSSGGKRVVALEYDVYRPMALKVLRSIASEAYTRFGVCAISIVHRTGRVSPGEIVVVIGVSSIHREEAYQASRYIIEGLKTRVPIWKKEVYTDGECWVEGVKLKEDGK